MKRPWFYVLFFWALEVSGLDYVTYKFVNQTSTNVYLQYYAGASCSSYSYVGARTMTPGEVFTYVQGYGVNSDSAVARWANGVKQECSGDNAAWSTNYFYFDGTSGAPPPTYYATGCVTNRSMMVQKFWIEFPTETKWSPPLAPGEYWCVNYTNSSPGTYRMGNIQYNADGGTNFLWEYPQDWWLSTNLPPGSLTPGGYSDPGEAPNNPAGSDTGRGSNTGLTGDQYSKGVSNIINSIWQAQQQNNQGFKLLSGNLEDVKDSVTSSANTTSNGLNNLGGKLDQLGNKLDGLGDKLDGLGTNMGTALVPWLSAISNRTDSATNYLGEIAKSSAYQSNLMHAAMTNAVSSNVIAMANSNGLAVSNSFYSAVTTTYVATAYSLTNLAGSDGSWTLWEVPVQTNCWGPRRVINFSPKEWKFVRAIVPWFRLIIMVGIVWMCYGYIYEKLSETSLGLYQIPGSGPGSGNAVIGSWWAVLVSPLVLAAMIAIFPILLVMGLQSISMFFGGVIISPLAEAGISVMSNAFGDYTAHARAALDLIFFFVPVGFIFSVFTYMVVFDLGVLAAAHFASYVIRTVTN